MNEINVSAALADISCMGCRTVVSGGRPPAAASMSSNPTTGSSSGTESPVYCAAFMPPSAMLSFA